MRKLPLIALLLIAVLALSGCSNRDAMQPVASPTASPSAAPTQTAAPTASPSAAPGGDQAALKDGEYFAQTSAEYAASQGYGWQEFLKVTVSGGKVTAADYNARMDDKLKSETTQDEYNMTPHPSVWIPQLSENVRSAAAPEDIDMITGATHAVDTARKLYAAILSAAQNGDTAAITLPDG